MPGSLIIWVRNPFLKNYVYSEDAIFYNVLYYQQLYIDCYQVTFYANSYIVSLPLRKRSGSWKCYGGYNYKRYQFF